MEKLPLGKALTIRITMSPAGAPVFAIADPTTHTRLFTGSAEDLAKLYPTPNIQEHVTGTKPSLLDKITGKKSEPLAEPEAISQA